MIERMASMGSIYPQPQRSGSQALGSVHAADPSMALKNARDVFTRRKEGVSVWVVRADDIVASDPDAKPEYSIRPKTRSTGIRRSIRCRMKSMTCDGGFDFHGERGSA